MNDIEKLKEMIKESNNIVFFGGAGVSTDSGIPDFRSEDGLYNSENKYDFPPEYMLSSDCFYAHTELFYKFYKDKMNCMKYEPNITHKYLKKLEDEGKLKMIVTQNIDGLHSKAGNKNICEIHGTIYKNHCTECNKEYSAEDVFSSEGIPTCSCGGVIKPDVVLYGEMLPEDVYSNAIKSIANADMLIVAGTSLSVYPAAGLVSLFRGKHLVIINNDKTGYDEKADLVINKSLKEVFNELSK